MMTSLLLASLVIVNCAAHGSACGTLTAPMRLQYEAADVRVAEESIGTATMEADGTIVLHLFARGPGGMHGQGVLRYPVSDPKYKEILEHVGPLKPGETRPVRPWPD
jgi:hypothetical protein